MMFVSKNEKGEPKIDKILMMKPDETMVTRRHIPFLMRKEFAIQPGRGRRAVCYGRVVSCIPHKDWYDSIDSSEDKDKILENEAHLEGFYTWDGLLKWFDEHHINIDTLYRVEFKKI